MNPHMLDNHGFKCAICEDTVANPKQKAHMQSKHNMIEISEHSNVQSAQIISKIQKHLQFTSRVNTSFPLCCTLCGPHLGHRRKCKSMQGTNIRINALFVANMHL